MWARIFSRERSNGQGLIFILSARRTGSTLLQYILCQSPDTHLFNSEAQFLTQLLAAFRWGDEQYERMLVTYFGDQKHYDSFQRRTLSDFLTNARRVTGAKKFLVLKNPELSTHVDQLIHHFPQAKFLILVRDPRDQIASEIEVIQRRDSNSFLDEKLLPTLCGNYRESYNLLLPLANDSSINAMVVRYEDLTQNLTETLPRLEDFLGIDLSNYDPHTYWNNVRVNWNLMRARPSWSENYGAPLTVDPVASFTKRLSTEQIRQIESLLNDLMERLDYGVWGEENKAIAS